MTANTFLNGKHHLPLQPQLYAEPQFLSRGKQAERIGRPPASALPECRATAVNGETHYSLADAVECRTPNLYRAIKCLIPWPTN